MAFKVYNAQIITTVIFVTLSTVFCTQSIFGDELSSRIYYAQITKRNASGIEPTSVWTQNDFLSSTNGKSGDNSATNISAMVDKLYQMTKKNFTFDFYIDGIHITTVDELLKVKNHESAIREVYQQIEQLENGGNAENDYFEDYESGVSTTAEHQKFSEENTNRPGDSSRIISRNSPQPNTMPSTIATNSQKHSINSSTTYRRYNYLYLILTLMSIAIILTKQC